MSNEKIRIKLKAYEHQIIDNAASKIVATVKRTGGEVRSLLFLELFTSIKILENNSRCVLTKDLSILITLVKRQLML